MKDSLKHLDFIIEHSEKIIYQYRDKDVKRIQYFYLGMFERLYAACKSLRVLIKEMDKDQSMEFSAGLITRTLLLDLLFSLRGYDMYKQGEVAAKKHELIEAELTEFCNSVFADGIRYTFSTLQHLKDAGIHTEAQLIEAYRNIANKYSAFVEPYKEDGSAPNIKFPKGPRVIDLFLITSKQEPLKKLAGSYETYSFYSKYEHFSILSYVLMRRLEEDQLRTFAYSIELMVMHAFISFETMNAFAPDDFLTHKIKTTGDYVKYEVLKLPKEQAVA